MKAAVAVAGEEQHLGLGEAEHVHVFVEGDVGEAVAIQSPTSSVTPEAGWHLLSRTQSPLLGATEEAIMALVEEAPR